LIQTSSGNASGTGSLYLNRIGFFSKAAAKTAARSPVISSTRSHGASLFLNLSGSRPRRLHHFSGTVKLQVSPGRAGGLPKGNQSVSPPGRSNRSSGNWAAPRPPHYQESGLNCWTATVSKRAGIVSKRPVKSPRVRFLENRWSSMTPSCVYRSTFFPVRMAMPKSGPC